MLVQGSTAFGSGAVVPGMQNGSGYGTPTTKAGYEAKAKREIQAYQTKIDRLKEKIKTEAETEKIKGEASIKILQARLDNAKLKLKKLEAASPGNWRKAKTDLDKALAGVHSEYKKAISFF